MMMTSDELKEQYVHLMGKFDQLMKLRGNMITGEELIGMIYLLVINNKSLFKLEVNGHDLFYYLIKFAKLYDIQEEYEEFIDDMIDCANNDGKIDGYSNEKLLNYTIEELINFTFEDYIKNVYIYEEIKFCDDKGPHQLQEMFKMYVELQD